MYLSRGSSLSERQDSFECLHVICAFKHNTDMITLYRTSTVCQKPEYCKLSDSFSEFVFCNDV